MIKFKRLTKKDYNLIKKYTTTSPLKICDLSIGVILMWDGSFKYEYCIINDTLIIKMYYGKEQWFLPPTGKDVESAVTELEKYCVENSIKLKFTCVDNTVLDFYKERYLDKAEFDYDRCWSDYIYGYQDVENFVGKKYSGQRNHINKFKRLYPNYKYHKITKKVLPLLKQFLLEYKKAHKKMGKIEKKEFENTVLLLDNYNFKIFTGGYITVNKKIVSFSVGEYVGNMLVIHVEKALTEYAGVYPTTFNEFVKHSKRENIIYVNREDDSGDLGLRTSKTQYQPIEVLHKYYFVVKNNMQIKKQPVIKGNGLYIDKITKQDISNYYKLYVNLSLNKYWGYDYRKYIKNPTANDFFNMVNNDFKVKDNMCLAIREKKGGELIGEVVLHHFGYDNTVEVGARLFKKYHGKGYGKKAFTLASNYVLNVLNKIPVAKAYKQNIKSISALEKAGFVKTGEDTKFYYFKR